MPLLVAKTTSKQQAILLAAWTHAMHCNWKGRIGDWRVAHGGARGCYCQLGLLLHGFKAAPQATAGDTGFAGLPPATSQAYKLLDFDFLGGSVLADIVAPYVYACWQIRWKVRNEEVRSNEREADGSNAMV
jgi:hypothetical protein